MPEILIEGPEDTIAALETALANGGAKSFFKRQDRRAFGGTTEVLLAVEVVDIAVHLLSLWLAGNHLARMVLKINRDTKGVNIVDAKTTDEIKRKLTDE